MKCMPLSARSGGSSTALQPAPSTNELKEHSRTIILHYHLFKNAGTTIDTILQNSYPGKWVTKEFAGPPGKIPPLVQAWIGECPEAVCFSSHTARMPIPSAPGWHVFPIFFLRHPIDRIRSAYEFERRQQGDNFGSVLARNTTFRGYVETRLALKHERQCRNFQTMRLAEMLPPTAGSELARATKAMDQLPVIGLVETFAQSMQRISSKLQEYGLPPLLLRDTGPKNTSSGSPRPLEESLRAVKSDLGPELYAKLEEANSDDLELHARLHSAYEAASNGMENHRLSK